jgi:phosphoglycolate phosphatase
LKFEHKKVIIFDLDGTLIDSSTDLAHAVNYMLTSMGREEFSLNEIHQWVGNGAQTLVRRALSGSVEIDENINEKEFKAALGIFLRFYESNLTKWTVTYSRVEETLQALKDTGYKLVIVTNKPFKFVAPILEDLNIAHYFEFYLGGDSLAEKKPNPTPLLHVCETLGVTPEQCVMVGDSKNDILAAKACDMDSIGVTYGYNYGEHIKKYEPTVYYSKFADIGKALC